IICLVILGAAVVNGLVNVGTQALKGNVNNLGQGLEYFAVGAVAGAAAVVPGGGMFLAGGIQAVGNKGVQYLNGQWDPSDINGVGDVAMLTLDMGLDFASAGAGAKLGEAIIKNTGWLTSISASGQFVQVGEHVTSGFRFAGNVEVTASRMGARKSLGSLLGKASKSAFKAADDFSSIFIKNKHLNIGSGRFSKFATSDINTARQWVQQALRSPSAR